MHGIRDDFQTILSSPYLTDEWGLPGAVVLLTGDGHWWIALDYRGGDEPSVTWFDTEWDWIRKRRAGWASDERRLRELRERR